MDALCKFGEQKLVGRGIFYICKQTGDHCIEHSRWCSQTNQYVGVGDCTMCKHFVVEKPIEKISKENKTIKEVEKSKEIEKPKE